MAKPSFFLVGAPKCGTTSLCHYLGQHPDIFIPRRKELCFFASDLELPRTCKGEQEYLHHFTCTSGVIGGEGTTWYLYSKTAAREINKFNAEAKIIISVRNPADMVYSLFRYRRHNGNEKANCLSHVLVREKQYVLNASNSATENPGYIYAFAALYYNQITRYIETFDASQIHIVVFDDMKDHPEKVYRGILNFLRVSDDFQPVFRHINKTGRIRSERFQERIAHLPPPVKRLAYVIPRVIRRPAYRALHRLNTSYRAPPPLDPELRWRLNDQFGPDVERLSALLGRDLTHWCAE